MATSAISILQEAHPFFNPPIPTAFVTETPLDCLFKWGHYDGDPRAIYYCLGIEVRKVLFLKAHIPEQISGL
jgi:hypothetical protein